MDFALTADQEKIRDTAESFLRDASGSAAVRAAMETEAGYDPQLWKHLAQELGWCATHIPEKYGGLELGWVEVALLMEQMGRRLLCAPFFATVCLAATALIEAALEPARIRYLPEIAAGRLDRDDRARRIGNRLASRRGRRDSATHQRRLSPRRLLPPCS